MATAGRAAGRRQDHWRADALLVLRRMHPNASSAFQREGPWRMVSRSLFAKAAREAGVTMEYLAFMLERMDIEGEVPR